MRRSQAGSTAYFIDFNFMRFAFSQLGSARRQFGLKRCHLGLQILHLAFQCLICRVALNPHGHAVGLTTGGCMPAQIKGKTAAIVVQQRLKTHESPVPAVAVLRRWERRVVLIVDRVDRAEERSTAYWHAHHDLRPAKARHTGMA